jgi:hypothetical protein
MLPLRVFGPHGFDLNPPTNFVDAGNKVVSLALIAGLGDRQSQACGFAREAEFGKVPSLSMVKLRRVAGFIEEKFFWQSGPQNTALPPLTREERAARARVAMDGQFSNKQRTFLEFVLGHYVDAGVDELDTEKLSPLLRLRYGDSIADAIQDLGRPEEISRAFVGFQRYLYATKRQ